MDTTPRWAFMFLAPAYHSESLMQKGMTAQAKLSILVDTPAILLWIVFIPPVSDELPNFSAHPLPTRSHLARVRLRLVVFGAKIVDCLA